MLIHPLWFKPPLLQTRQLYQIIVFASLLNESPFHWGLRLKDIMRLSLKSKLGALRIASFEKGNKDKLCLILLCSKRPKLQ